MKQKIFKALSVLLTLALVFSTCICSVSANADTQDVIPEEPKGPTYYVASEADNGSDSNNGTDASTPVLSIYKALSLAVAQHPTADTVVIKTIGSGAISTGHTSGYAMPTHNFKLFITANDPAVPGLIAGDVRLGGETHFDNVTIESKGNNANGSGFTFNGMSTTFGENAYLGASGSDFVFLGKNYSTDLSTTAPTNIKINELRHKGFYLTGNNKGKTIYNYPVTIEIDNWAASYSDEVFGGFIFSYYQSSSAHGTTEFKEPVNLKVDQSNIRLVFKADNSRVTYGEKFALQVINSTGKDIAKTGDKLTRGDSTTSVHTSALDNIDASKKYIIHNNTGNRNAVEFTDTVGKYKVNLNPELFKIRAKAEGKEDVLSENGFLNLTAGEWTLTVEKEPNLVATYFVSPEGSDDDTGEDENHALASVEKAVQLANEMCYGAGDTVYIKAINVAGKAIVWTPNSSNKISPHTFTLDLSSNGDKATVGTTNQTLFNGPTNLSNVKLAWGKGYPTIYLGGNDVVFGEGVSTTSAEYDFCYASGGTLDKEYNLTFKGTFNKKFHLGGNYDNVPTINGKVNLTYDGSANYDLKIGSLYGTQSAGKQATKINGTVNINLKSAAGVKMDFVNNIAQVRYGNNSVVQVINSIGADSTAWDTALSTNQDLAKPSKYYIVNNKSGLGDRVSFTDTVGKYNVNFTDAWTLTITDKDGKPVNAQVVDGILDLTALPSGTYNIEAVKAVEELFVYVSPNGDDANDGLKVNTPVATVNKAIAIAKEKELAATDILNVKVIYVEGASALIGADTNTIAQHGFKLNISSATDEIASLGNNNGLALGGKTEIENLTLNIASTQNDVVFIVGTNDLHIGKNVIISGGNKINIDMSNIYMQDFSTSHTIYFGSALIGTRQGAYGMPVYNAPQKVIYDNDGDNSYNMAGYGRAGQFRNKFSFDIRNVKSFTLKAARSDGSPGYEISNTAVFELINNSKADVSAAIEFIKGLKTTGGAKVPYYIYENKTGIANAIELTDTLGKIKVNIDTSRFQLLANGTPVEVVESCATLPAGHYNFTVKLIKAYTDTYFVKTGATGGNGTEAAPFATVAEAIAAANKKISVYGDNITIKLVGKEAVIWGETEEFSFIPVVESANKKAITTVVIDKPLQGGAAFDYVAIDAGSEKLLLANGNDIKLGKNVKGDVQFIGAEKDTNDKNGQTVEINTAAIKNIYVGNASQNNITYKGNVNYIINNSAANLTFNFIPEGGRNLTIYGNFSIKVDAASSLSFKNPVQQSSGKTAAGEVIFDIEDTGAGLVVPADVKLNDINYFKDLTENHYIVKAGKGVDINTTEYIDEYSVEFDKTMYNLVVTDAQGNTNQAYYSGGILLLYNPGEYTVKVKCKECVYDKECDTTCNRCGAVDKTRKHLFSAYTLNTAAECEKNATEISSCDYGCGTKNILDVAGTALKHKYTNSCDISCNICSATRSITHAYKTTTTKATTSKNGSIVKKCSVCDKVYSTTKIYYAKKVKLSTTEYTYSSSKTRKPSVKVYDYKGNKISSSNYTVTYASGRKKVGKYKVTIKLKGKYSGTLTAYFTIVPKESKVEKLTAAKKSLKVKLKKVSSQATGYEIQYSTSKTFKSKYTKTKKVSYKTTSVTLKSLKAKKTYYVRVRTYKTVNGKKYYSDWSSKKYKKTK